MAAKMEKTRTPGIYKRGSRYVFSYRGGGGAQRWESCRTLDEARRAKAARSTDVARGEFSPLHRVTLREYALDWIERYQGTGRRGFRPETQDEYRRLLDRYALRYFPQRTLLSELEPRAIAGFIGWLTRQPSKHGGALSDRSVRNALGPLAACLATARREGLIRHNPAADAALPHRSRVEEDEERPRPFPGDTMELVVSLMQPRYRLMFELLAATGLRRSELLALEVRHLALSGERPHVKVRQRVRRQRGNGLVIGALKSRYARRELPVPLQLADRLAAKVGGRPPAALVFPSEAGTVPDPDNLATRVLGPACEEAGVGWAGFHTFRHTVASRLFAAGRNVVQVQRWLGHHSPSFTLDTYVHLLEDDLGQPLGGVNKVQTDATPLDASGPLAELPQIGD
jgi:integrase